VDFVASGLFHVLHHVFGLLWTESYILKQLIGKVRLTKWWEKHYWCE